MSKPNYRVNVTFDGERKVFIACAPELEHCTAEAATRPDALAKLEEEIDAQLANMLSHGMQPPRSVDEETFSGEVSAKLSKGLHREIAYQARAEGVEVEHLVAELLAAAMESRKQTRAPRSGNRAPAQASQVDHDNIGNRAPSDHHGGGRPQRGFGRGGNPAMLDDRATFIEYVRGLENGQYQGGGHNRGPHGGGHGGGHGGDGRRRRGRGGRGGGNPNFRGNGGSGPNANNGGGFNGRGGNGPQQQGGAPNAQGGGQGGGHMSSAPNAAPPSGQSGPMTGGDDGGQGEV
jgi:predicted RNase H-like HicB family nuclease